MATEPTPTKVIIRPYPFNSTLALKLVNALDADLSALHPDWDDLPHPGYNQVFVQADSRANSLSVVPTEYQIGKPRAVLDAVDADDGEVTVSEDVGGGIGGGEEDEMPSNWRHLHPEDVARLHFFIAFDVTDTDTDSSAATTRLSDPATIDYTGKAIGCVGLKPLPYFPHHRSQPPPSLSTSSTTSTNLRHAELKRMYVLPSHRHTEITTPSNPTSTRLATALVQVAISHAKRLGVNKLVLETGVRQIAAMRLYERLGWRRREMYGDYVGAGVGDGGVGVCYEVDVGEGY